MFSTFRLESATPTSSGRPVTADSAAFTAVISWKISMRTASPSLICGVTRSVTPMSWRSTFTDVARSSPVASLMPDADCTRFEMIGMFAPTLISASSLSAVRMFGAERMLVAVHGRRRADHALDQRRAGLDRGHRDEARGVGSGEERREERLRGVEIEPGRRILVAGIVVVVIIIIGARAAGRERSQRGIGEGSDGERALVLVEDADQTAEAEVLLVADVDLHDQRLDQHLRALAVELVDHRLDGLVALLAGLDDERVRRRVGRDADAFRELGDRRADRRVARGGGGLGRDVGDPGAARARGAAAGRGRHRLPADQRVQGLRELLGVRVLQVVDVDAAAARRPRRRASRRRGGSPRDGRARRGRSASWCGRP